MHQHGVGQTVSPGLAAALRVLRDVKGALAPFGIAHVGVFGSAARGGDTAGSDLDVVLTLAEDADPDPLDLIKAEERVRAAFATAMPGVAVDVSLREDMREPVRERCDAEALYAD
jgi:predicted nucleotidyltransferase